MISAKNICQSYWRYKEDVVTYTIILLMTTTLYATQCRHTDGCHRFLRIVSWYNLYFWQGTRLGVSSIFWIILQHDSECGMKSNPDDFGELFDFGRAWTGFEVSHKCIYWNEADLGFPSTVLRWQESSCLNFLITMDSHCGHTCHMCDKMQTPAVNLPRRVSLSRLLSCGKQMLTAIPCMALTIIM